MERNEYEAKAQEFLDKHDLTIKMAFKGDRCPPWQGKGGCIHGDRYRITVKRAAEEFGSSITAFGPRSISFDYWNSMADMQADRRPSVYDILSTLASESHAPTDPDEVAEEFGDTPPSQAIAIAKFAQRLQDFFTEQEFGDLGEIN